MKKFSIIYLIFIGLIGFVSSCEKDGTKVEMLTDPIAPTIKTLPNLTLLRAKGTDTLVFKGTLVNPGFQASATYFLEADTAGNQFKNPTLITSGIQDTVIKITVGNINSTLIKRFPSDVASSLEFRIRSVLVADAGTGAKPIESVSPVKPVSVTTYGLPRLDLMAGTTVAGKITSAAGDGKYFNFVKLNAGTTFKLKDPETNNVYGVSGDALALNGSDFTAATTGWYLISADTKGLTYQFKVCQMGVIGDATPNGWNSPDTKMDYDPKSESWFVTVNLTAATIKFRSNDSWDNAIYNLGIGTGYSTDNLWNSSSSANIPISAAGNYTIRLYLNSTPLRCTITKNN